MRLLFPVFLIAQFAFVQAQDDLSGFAVGEYSSYTFNIDSSKWEYDGQLAIDHNSYASWALLFNPSTCDTLSTQEYNYTSLSDGSTKLVFTALNYRNDTLTGYREIQIDDVVGNRTVSEDYDFVNGNWEMTYGFYNTISYTSSPSGCLLPTVNVRRRFNQNTNQIDSVQRLRFIYNSSQSYWDTMYWDQNHGSGFFEYKYVTSNYYPGNGYDLYHYLHDDRRGLYQISKFDFVDSSWNNLATRCRMQGQHIRYGDFFRQRSFLNYAEESEVDPIGQETPWSRSEIIHFENRGYEYKLFSTWQNQKELEEFDSKRFDDNGNLVLQELGNHPNYFSGVKHSLLYNTQGQIIYRLDSVAPWQNTPITYRPGALLYLNDSSSCNYGTSTINPIQPEISIYPNPSQGSFVIDLPSDLGQALITIYSTVGELVFKQTTNNQESFSIDLSNNPKGMYIVHIGSKTVDVRKKIVLR